MTSLVSAVIFTDGNGEEFDVEQHELVKKFVQNSLIEDQGIDPAELDKALAKLEFEKLYDVKSKRGSLEVPDDLRDSTSEKRETKVQESFSVCDLKDRSKVDRIQIYAGRIIDIDLENLIANDLGFFVKDLIKETYSVGGIRLSYPFTHTLGSECNAEISKLRANTALLGHLVVRYPAKFMPWPRGKYSEEIANTKLVQEEQAKQVLLKQIEQLKKPIPSTAAPDKQIVGLPVIISNDNSGLLSRGKLVVQITYSDGSRATIDSPKGWIFGRNKPTGAVKIKYFGTDGKEIVKQRDNWITTYKKARFDVGSIPSSADIADLKVSYRETKGISSEEMDKLMTQSKFSYTNLYDLASKDAKNKFGRTITFPMSNTRLRAYDKKALEILSQGLDSEFGYQEYYAFLKTKGLDNGLIFVGDKTGSERDVLGDILWLSSKLQ